jgi:gluconokinase
VLMGVSGSGKTTLGKLLAQKHGWSFFDADDFHPPANIEKMAQGVALTDVDRIPWLDVLRRLIDEHRDSAHVVLLACSALKQSYRDRLSGYQAGVLWVYLKGDFASIEQRLQERRGHYMSAKLLTSQFATLEEPHNALVIDTALPAEKAAELIAARIEHP